MKKQDKKQAGFIVSIELILIATILVIGLIVGMTALRDATVAEYEDVAEAIGALDQSYQFFGVQDANGLLDWTAGSQWIDAIDSGIEGGDTDSVVMNRLPNDSNESMGQDIP